jgi:flagellar basal-body rod protein FlgB
MEVTAGNMANIDTPGYRTEGFDFTDALLKQFNDSTETDKLGGGHAQVEYVDGLVSRPDGNNVSIDRESIQLAKSQMQFRLGEQLLKHEFSSVMSAIHMDGK